jgi:hypothetical protein
LRSYFVQPDIHALQFEQLLKDGEHRGILAHGSGLISWAESGGERRKASGL